MDYDLVLVEIYVNVRHWAGLWDIIKLNSFLFEDKEVPFSACRWWLSVCLLRTLVCWRRTPVAPLRPRRRAVERFEELA